MLLAIDTSTHTAGIALYDGVRVLSEYIWTSKNNQSVELAPAIIELMMKSGVKPAQLTALAVALGPGSFTGLRISLALAKGIAYVNHIPVIGVPSLDILAAAQPVRKEPLAAVLRAGRGRLAVGWYQADSGEWKSTGKPVTLTPLELNKRIHGPTLVCGELSEDEKRLLARKRKNVILASPAQSVRRPAYLAELGWRRFQTGKIDNPATLTPIYLHYNLPIPEV
jgi:tRNA threonylcarbamoyladenosine biosynthesis protein TsaB